MSQAAKKKKQKYLVETSAVRPALGQSTPKHCQHFSSQVADGALFTSLYIRKEFIRRWVCGAARLAFAIAQFGEVEAALYYLEQDFSQRDNKAVIATIAAFLRQIGPLANTAAAAEEVAGLAVRWLALFDSTFPSRTGNTCGCRIGGMILDVDFNSVLDDLNEFYRSFSNPVTNCAVNDFLQLDRLKGRATPLLADEGASKLPVIQKLEKYADAQTWVTCKECGPIGDAVVALEQQASWTLVHTDEAFTKLCPVLGRKNKLIPSARALDRDVYRVLNPKPGSGSA
jgi:hypothetical protein